MVKALDKTLKKFIASAIFSKLPNAKNEKNLPRSKQKGAPGGWGTSNLFDTAINSPASQKLAVSSTVIEQTIIAIKKQKS